MALDPGPPGKNERGSGGRSPLVGLGFGSLPARVWVWVRVRPHYPDLPGLGPRRDTGWAWYWVLGLGEMKGYKVGIAIRFRVHGISPGALKSQMVRVPVFLNSELLKMDRVPISS